MAETPRVNGLEIKEDVTHERRQWVVERVGWIIMLLIVLAALAGLFGNGPASKTHAGSPEGDYAVEYQRFARLQAPSTFKVTLTDSAVTEGKARLWLSHDFLKDVEIERVTPEPDGVEASSDGFAYTYQADRLQPPVEVTFTLKPERFGSIAGRAGISADKAVSIKQFVYP